MDSGDLEEGFYLDTNSGRIVYFTGKYNIRDNAISEGLTTSNKTRSITSDWRRISRPENYLKNTSKDLEWMQQKLSKLEQAAKIANLSAQNL